MTEWILTYIIAPVLVGFVIGIIAWLAKAYERLCGIENTCSAMNTNMEKALARLDTHENRLDGHDLMFARLEGAGQLRREQQ